MSEDTLSRVFVARPENAQQTLHVASLSVGLSEEKRQQRLQQLLDEQKFSDIGLLADDKVSIIGQDAKVVGTIQPGDVLWQIKRTPHVLSVYLPLVKEAAEPS